MFSLINWGKMGTKCKNYLLKRWVIPFCFTVLKFKKTKNKKQNIYIYMILSKEQLKTDENIRCLPHTGF